MANTFINDIRNQFRNGNVLAQLIIVNVLIFIPANIISSFNPHDYGIVRYLMLPPTPGLLLEKPWSLLSYMFTHTGFMHVFFNMLWLYWMGKIFSEYLGNARLLSVYISSGIAGGALFMMMCALTDHPGFQGSLLGASASVMGIVIAIATYVPNYTLNLFLIGNVQLKYVALASFILTTLLDLSDNTGGKISHMGGALFGYLYIVRLKKGKDLLRFFHRVPGRIKNTFSSFGRGNMKIAYKKKISDEEYNAMRAGLQKKTDDILDKISKSGYESLSKEEKEFLFRQSNTRKE